jgi:presequence protease
MDKNDLPLLPLLTRMLTETGTSKYSEEALTYKIGSETGGISTSFMTDLKSNHGLTSSSNDASLYFTIRGKSTVEKIPLLFDIMKDILLDANLNNQKRAIEILKETKVRRESQVITNGHTYGASRLAARYSPLGYIGEMTSGLSYIRCLGGLLNEAENDWSTLHTRLVNLRDTIIKKQLNSATKDKLIINLTGEEKLLETATTSMNKFLADIPSAKTTSTTSLLASIGASQLLPIQNEGFSVTAQVNYVVKGGQLFEPNEPIKGSYNVVSKYLSTGYLWDNVRVMGENSYLII